MNLLLFSFDYNNGSQYVKFDYDVASESVDTISVAGIGNGMVSLTASCHADMNISSYTSATTLDWVKDFEDSVLTTYPDNYAELCDTLVRMAIPAFGLQLAESVGMTLADIGFTAY